ncbi:MAG: hypothetical protein PVJ09_01515 [Candidatus Woesebacteria bacterium]|jgi:hypothetical protein
MSEHKYHEAPLVSQLPVSLIVLENSDLEAQALRLAFERFWFNVNIHFIGSRKQLLEILKGNIKTEDLIFIACHGDEKEGIYTCPGEKPLSAEDVKEYANLKDKNIVSLGCETGNKELANSFLDAGVKKYIAPSGAPFGNSAYLFGTHIAYELAQNKKSLEEAFETARSYDKESQMFKLFEKNS